MLFFLGFNGSSTRKEDLQMLSLKSKEKWWKISAVVTNFSNDESVCRPALLKTVSTTGILIDQVHKFQNSYFKEHLRKAATVLQKAYCLRGVSFKIRAWYEICS